MKTFSVIVTVFFCILSGTRSTETGLRDADLPSLRDSHASRKTQEFEVDPTTGAGVENIQTCSLADRFDNGFQRSGPVIRTYPTESAVDCARFCAFVITGCVAVNYDTETQMCSFLESTGTISPATNITTALLSATKEDICNSDNMILNYARAAVNTSDSPLYVSNATECCNVCYDRNDCVSFAFHADSGQCWLKTENADLGYYRLRAYSTVCNAPAL